MSYVNNLVQRIGNCMKFRHHFLLISLTLTQLITGPVIAQSLTGDDVLQAYGQLLKEYNRSEGVELQANRVDQYLAEAKEYLREHQEERGNDDFQAIEYSVKKLKTYQYLFNTQHNALRLEETNENFHLLSDDILIGAMNSSPKSLFDHRNFDFQALNLASFATDGKEEVLFTKKTRAFDLEFEKKRISFIRSMVNDSLIKNQLATWTLDYVFNQKEVECRYVDMQVQQRCQVVANLLHTDKGFEYTDPLKLFMKIIEIRSRAEDALERNFDNSEEFHEDNYNRDALERLSLPSVEKRFPEHIQILNEIKKLKQLQLLRADPRAKRLVDQLATPMVSKYCQTRNYPAVANCGYKRQRGEIKNFNPKFIQQSLARIYVQISDEKSRLSNLRKNLDYLEGKAENPLKDVAVSNYQVYNSYNKVLQISSDIDSIILKEVSINPQSLGAALMDHPTFIAKLPSSLFSMLEKLDSKQFQENLVSVGVIVALVGSSFITVPIGVGLGLTITVYEIAHYSAKQNEYRQKRDAASVELIEYQLKDLDLNQREITILSERFDSFQNKYEYYRMNAYFAAVGLISAPIALGHIINASSNKLTSILDNIKFLEKLVDKYNSSSEFQAMFQQLLAITKIKHPDQLLSALMKLRRYIQEARTLSEALFIHRLHHLIKHPERLHLTERSFAGAAYLQKLLVSEDVRGHILTLLEQIESTPSNYFNQ